MIRLPSPPVTCNYAGVNVYEACTVEISELVATKTKQRLRAVSIPNALRRYYEDNYPTLQVASVQATLRGWEVVLVDR
jgi:hypothetical protein